MHTVYWSHLPINKNIPDDLSLLIEEPIPVFNMVLKEFGKKNFVRDKDSMFFNCPAFKNVNKNVFAITSPVNLTFDLNDTRIQVKELAQREFDNMIHVRNFMDRFLSINFGLLMFSGKSVQASQLPAYMSSCEMAVKTRIVPGVFDISKWFRPFELSFFVNEFNNTLSIKRGDPLFYICFDTDEDIEFKRFKCTDKLTREVDMCLSVKRYVSNLGLEQLYNMFNGSRTNKRVLKLIEQNLI